MYQLLLVITLSLVCAPQTSFFVAEIENHGPIERQNGSLLRKVENVVKEQLVEGTDKFEVPTDAQITGWSDVVGLILENKIKRANEIVKKHSFPYRIIRFTDNTVKREYILLEEYRKRRGWGFYAFYPKSASRLVIEVPHPKSDSNTEHEGIEAFRETGAKAFLLAGAHRRTNKSLSRCTQATIRSRYAESDVARSVRTVFHKTHEILFSRYADSLVVQLHGMRNREICPNVFLSTGTKDVTTNSNKLLRCLTRNRVESGIYDGKTSTCPLIARTNVQGRYSNGLGNDACLHYAKTSPEPGRFIHVEQEPNIRKNQRNWRPVIEALKCAFPESKE